MTAIFCYGDEENTHRACTQEYLTTANQSEIRKAYLVSVMYGNTCISEAASVSFRQR